MSQNNIQEKNNRQAFTKDDAYYSLNMINTWIGNIDTKISFALALSGLLIGNIFSVGFPDALKRVSKVSKLSELYGGEIIAAIIVCLLYIVSFLSILYFMLAIIARVKNLNNTPSIYFFGSISVMDLQDYKYKVNNITEQEIIEDLQEQIHTNSKICNEKVKCYNKGIKFLFATIILWFISMTFRLI